MNMVPVTIRPSPISAHRVTHLMPSGMTIAEMLRNYPEELPAAFFDSDFGVLEINGERVPQEWWPRLRPRRDSAREIVITMYLKPMGGGQGDSGKNTALILGSIALVAATAGVGAFGVPFLGIAAGSFGAQVAATGLGIAGALALGALAPTPAVAKNNANQSGFSALDRTVGGIGGNPLRAFETIPRVLGLVTVSPPHLISPYSKMVSDAVHWYACVGLAGKTDITSIRINGMDAATFETLDSHSSETGGAQTLATENVIEDFSTERLSTHQVKGDDDLGRELVDQATPANSCPMYHYYRTSGIPSKVRIRFLFPTGLGYLRPTDGLLVGAQVGLLIEARLVGTVPWKVLPILRAQGDLQRELHMQVELSFGTTNAAELTVSPAGANRTNYAAYYSRWTHLADTVFQFSVPSLNAKNIERVGETSWKIHMPTATFPLSGEYEIRIKRSSMGVESPGTGLNASLDVFSFETEATIDKVPGDDTGDRQNAGGRDVIVESFSTVRSGLPLVTTDLSYVEIDATDLRIDSISFKAESKADNWSGSAWGTAGNTNTRNPASLFRHVLLDPTLNGEPLDAALLDDSASGSLVEWYNYCVANNLECNTVIEGRSVEEVLQIICACGHANLRRSDTWGVIIEQDRSAAAITQMFTTHNAWSHSIKKVFADPPLDGLYVTYLDQNDDHQPAERLVTYSGGPNVEAIEFPGVTLAARIDEVANLALRQRALRTNFYSFNTDIQALVSQRGDLVGYEFDVIDEFRFSAWVTKAILNTAGACVGVVLDSAIDIATLIGDIYSALDVYALADVYAGSNSLGIVFRQNNGIIVSRTIDTTNLPTGDTRTIMFTATIPVAGDASLLENGLAVVGILNTEARRCIVFDIEWEQDQTARITLVDEAPSIHPL